MILYFYEIWRHFLFSLQSHSLLFSLFGLVLCKMFRIRLRSKADIPRYYRGMTCYALTRRLWGLLSIVCTFIFFVWAKHRQFKQRLKMWTTFCIRLIMLTHTSRVFKYFPVENISIVLLVLNLFLNPSNYSTLYSCVRMSSTRQTQQFVMLFAFFYA